MSTLTTPPKDVYTKTKRFVIIAQNGGGNYEYMA